jgi:hypothetical protein
LLSSFDVLTHSRRDIRKSVNLSMGMAKRCSHEFALVLERHHIMYARVTTERLATIDPRLDDQTDSRNRKVRERLIMVVAIDNHFTMSVRR